MKIVLLGYMASGKSLIGRELAKVLKMDYLDLDDFIEKNEGKSIEKIFLEKGEIFFRKIENSYLQALISSKNNLVLSLGGGTPCFTNNLELLKNNKEITTFFLNVPVSELAKRLMSDKENRPLVKYVSNETDMLEFVGKHLFERLPFYNQAHFKMDANKPKEEVVESIITKLF
ncbi:MULTISPECIES: shikimate kinase [Xanthomarina]|jgi:shikimate kinase|nr:shikimate kinase [Xanthomarina sp.]MCB0388167.1 shikimate kinase [Winogradskyella sp.]HAB26471.1 shikimate kinase [Xanthomarina gelatinilytica]MAL22621.1 shikimate kinase [Xanthomarina sp.]MBF62748.1 shikimate kinase [Xanthomarina sp.]HAI16664.1 shikimate kinase [Xanthomarina gelatinilytica]|tara:strand:+ start:174 stop:692 length:519 start_codon:yes stop_codon:yes gene_type:complete